jgi:hypothetical protein
LLFDVLKKDLIVSKYDKAEEIDIRFKRKRIRGLTQIDVVIWSRGNEPIRRSDFLDADRLTIKFDTFLPIANEVPCGSRIAIDPSIRKLEDGFEIEFDILENNDAIHVSFLFDSSSAPKVSSVTICGSVSGLAGGCQRRKVHDNHRIISIDVIFWIGMLLFSLFICKNLFDSFFENLNLKSIAELEFVHFLNTDFLAFIISVFLFTAMPLAGTLFALSSVWRSRNAISGSGRRFLKDRGIL